MNFKDHYQLSYAKVSVRGILLGLLVLLFISIVWRFVDLERDPAIISWSADAWLDPGHYLNNVRSFSLFGQWRPDEGHSLYVAPGYVLLATGWFRLWGFGFWQAVLLSTIAGFFAIGATAVNAQLLSSDIRGTRWKYLPIIAVLVSLLLSYVFFARQRVPKGDMEYMAVCSLTALAFAYLPHAWRNGRYRWMICLGMLGGFGLGIAPFVKLFAGLFSIAVLTAWIVSYFLLDQEWLAIWRKTTPFIMVGVAISGLVWLAWALWLVNMDAFDTMLRTVAGVSGTVISFLHISTNGETFTANVFAPGRFLESNLFYRQFVETILASVAFFRFIGGYRWNWPTLLTCIWLAVGVVGLSYMHYSPLRYRMLFLLPMVALAAQLWTELAIGKVTILNVRQSLFVYTASAFVLSYAMVYSLFGHFAPSQLRDGLSIMIVVISFTALGAPLLWLCFTRIPPRLLAVALACVLVFSAAIQWQAGEHQVTHDIRDTATEISQKYPDHILVFGQGGSLIPFFTKNDAYMAWVPGAMGKATLFVGEESDLPMFPVCYSEVGRKKLPNLKRTLVIAKLNWDGD